MSKLDEIKADLARLDALTRPDPNSRLATLRVNVKRLEDEREDIDRKLREAVQELDKEEATQDPAKKAASTEAVNIANKYGKSIADLRAILAAVG